MDFDWSSQWESLCVYSVHFLQVNEEYACANVTNVGSGFISDFTALCDKETNTATITIFAYDPSRFAESDVATFGDTQVDICPNPVPNDDSTEGSYMIKAVYEVPCTSYPEPRCPPREPYECIDAEPQQYVEVFDNAEDVDSWNGGASYDTDLEFLSISGEAQRSYFLPDNTEAVFVEFELFFSGSPGKVVLSAGVRDINISPLVENGEAFKGNPEGLDIIVETSGHEDGPSGLTKIPIKLTIPADYYGTRNLKFGASAESEDIALDNIVISVQCMSPSTSPSQMPTIDCVDTEL